MAPSGASYHVSVLQFGEHRPNISSFRFRIQATVMAPSDASYLVSVLQAGEAYLVLEEGLFKGFSEGSCHRLIAVRLHVIGGVYVEGAMTPHNQPRGQAAIYAGQILNDKGMLFRSCNNTNKVDGSKKLFNSQPQ